jgi:hypothetical protein
MLTGLGAMKSNNLMFEAIAYFVWSHLAKTPQVTKSAAFVAKA